MYNVVECLDRMWTIKNNTCYISGYPSLYEHSDSKLFFQLMFGILLGVNIMILCIVTLFNAI